MDKSKAKNILIVTCVSYFSFGVMWASLGPLLAQFASRNLVTLATMGGIYTAVFLGAVLSQIVLGPFTDRLGLLRSLTVALLLLALGITGVSLSHWLPLTFALAFLAGIGHGTANLCGNVMIGRIFKEKSVSAVNLLNVFFGFGAFIGPLLVSFSLFTWQNGFPALWFGAVVMLTSALVLMAAFFNEKIGSQGQVQTKQVYSRMHYSAFLWSLGALILVYVGTETALGGWATTYLQNTTSLTIELAAMVTAGFWLAITLGRMMGAVLGSRLSAVRVLVLCLAISVCGGILFLLSYGQSALSIAAILIMGTGFGAIYPTGMAMMTSAYPDAPGQAGSLITAMGSTGGALFPWLLGIALAQLGMRSGTFLMAGMLALIVVSFVVNQKLAKKI